MRAAFGFAVLFVCAVSAASAADIPEALRGTWLAEDIRGGGVLDRIQSRIDIAPDGKVTGSGGCNQIRGSIEVREAVLSFGPIVSTRIACVPAVGDQEAKFLKALEEAKGWKVVPEEGKLLLLDASGGTLLRLASITRRAALTIEVPNAESVENTKAVYDCGSRKVEVEYLNAGTVSLATLTINGEFVVAAQVISASGARYAGGQYVWWSKGREATLQDVTQGESVPPMTCVEAG